MTQNEKDLLLKDLCARVPYGVKFKHESRRTIGKILSIYPHRKWAGVIYFDDAINHPKECDMDDIKPYLFPLSSMTEEQIKELSKLGVSYGEYALHDDIRGLGIMVDEAYIFFEFCYKHHIDFLGLIDLGLAIDASGKNIY